MSENRAEVSPYATPNADLNVEGSINEISKFKRFTAWGVFGLSIITLGIYPAYWLYTRSKVLNSIIDDGISLTLLNIFLVLVVVSFAVGFLSGALPDNSTLATINSFLTIPYLIIYLVILFKFRNRLRDLTNLNINGVITFFGSAIYLQYKINKAIDNQ